MPEKICISETPPTRGTLLARNALCSLLGQILPLLVAFFTIPLLMRGLGVERFGVMTLIWMVIGYFTLFDLGLSRATTKFVAEAVGKNANDQIPDLVWTSFILHLLLGIGAGLLLAVLAPVLVGSVIKIPAAMRAEAQQVFLILALSLPLVLMSTVLRGVIEARQRFDLITMVQIPAGVLMFLLPLAGLYLGFGLAGIVLLLVISRIATLLVYFLLCLKVFPVLRAGFRFNPRLIRPLITFGGWMTLSNVAGPLLLYLDRFMIGSFISIAAVTYYTAPYEIIIRLMVFPTSMIMVLFPAFSSLGSTSRETVIRLYTRSMKYLLLAMAPLVLVMIFFAADILQFWLGGDFSQKSTLVFQLLAAGMLLTPIQVTVSLLHGFGRPDITAKFYVLELLLYIPLTWFLITRMGIAGAALSWTLRALLDTVLVLLAAGRVCEIRFRDFIEHGFVSVLPVVVILMCVFWVASLPILSLTAQLVMAICGVAVFASLSWRYILDAKDREMLSFGRMK